MASWIAYFAAGVRFDASPFPGYIQFIDAELLRERLLESIWYSHAQPPGLNLLVGLAYRVFGDGAPTFLSLLFHGLAFVVALGLFALTLRLTGTRSNRSAIGARIAVRVRTEGGPREIHRVVGSGGSFGASTLQQEIGLGAATSVERVLVRWPSGATEEFGDVPLDAVVALREGSGS